MSSSFLLSLVVFKIKQPMARVEEVLRFVESDRVSLCRSFKSDGWNSLAFFKYSWVDL